MRFFPIVAVLVLGLLPIASAQAQTEEDVNKLIQRLVELELNVSLIRHSVLQRTAETVAGNLLGLTVGCAKCHDHKYEPIPQRDYYQFLALFQPAFNPDNWLQPATRQLPDVSPSEKVAIEKHNAEIDRQLGDLQKQIAAVPKPYNDADKATVANLEKQRAELSKQKKKKWGFWQVVYDVGTPTPTRLLKRGNHETPGDEVAPGFFSVLCSSDAASLVKKGSAEGKSSGRRMALAQWLTDTKSPAGALVLRVRVNRIWQHVFGRGIVTSADNFGTTGAAPTHPELLDWLAGEFAANGQRLKPFLKLLLMSNAYRQASIRPPDLPGADPRKVDPDNQLLWRMRLRRLESEAIRDSILTVSGKLDRTFGGAPIPVESKPDGTFVVSEKGLSTPTSAYRRSIYLLARRNYHLTLLGVFDQPNLTTNCTGRASSAVVLQALTMLNDPFLLEQASFLAERVAKSKDSTTEKRIDLAFRLALNRAPKAKETAWCVELLQRQTERYRGEKLSLEQADQKALTHLCHTLLNTSEFLSIP